MSVETISGQLDFTDELERRSGARRDNLLRELATYPRWAEQTRRIASLILEHAPLDRAFSANQIRHVFPADTPTALIGPAFGSLARKGFLERVGWVPSTDPGTHGKPVASYRVVTL